MDWESRMLPSAPRAMACAASGVRSIFSRRAMWSRWVAMIEAGMGRRSKRWQRLRIVGRTLCASVVAKTNFTWPGGSSRVFSSALKAWVVSMWTSSM